MIRPLCIGMALLAVGASAHGALLLDNGPFETGAASNGNRISMLQAGYDTLGIVNNGYAAVVQRAADDFTVPAGERWQLSDARWYAYQGSGPVNPFTKVYVGIYTAEITGTTDLSPAYGSMDPGTAPNRLLGQTFTNVYRVNATTPTGTTRAIYELQIDLSWVPELDPGHYWLAVGLGGSTDTATVASIPVTPVQGNPNGLAWGRNRGSGVENFWQLADGNIPSTDPTTFEPYDYPFKLNGTIVPEPATLSLMALVSLVIVGRRR